MKIYILILCLALTACQNMRGSSFLRDPAGLSSDTLCYRYATTRAEKLGAEIARRNIDCTSILASDPLYKGR